MPGMIAGRHPALVLIALFDEYTERLDRKCEIELARIREENERARREIDARFEQMAAQAIAESDRRMADWDRRHGCDMPAPVWDVTPRYAPEELRAMDPD